MSKFLDRKVLPLFSVKEWPIFITIYRITTLDCEFSDVRIYGTPLRKCLLCPARNCVKILTNGCIGGSSNEQCENTANYRLSNRSEWNCFQGWNREWSCLHKRCRSKATEISRILVQTTSEYAQFFEMWYQIKIGKCMSQKTCGINGCNRNHH
jgi:hypothetical protein